MADEPGATSAGWWLSGVARSAARLPLRRLRLGFGPFLDQPSSKALWRTQNEKCHKHLKFNHFNLGPPSTLTYESKHCRYYARPAGRVES